MIQLSQPWIVAVLVLGLCFDAWSNELHEAAAQGVSPLRALVSKMDAPTLRKKLSECDLPVRETPGRPQGANHQCDTVLHVAALSRQAPAVVYLVSELGMKVDTRNKQGLTSLHRAFMAPRENPRDCEPRLYATVKALLEHGADPNLPFKRCKDCDPKDTVLHHEAFSGNRNGLIPVLITRGASLHATNSQGETPLHLAAKCLPGPTTCEDCGCFTMKGPCLGVDAVKCPLSTTNVDNGKISFFGALPTVRYLINKGANLMARTNQGKLPLQLVAGPQYPSGPGGDCRNLYTYLHNVTNRKASG